MVTACFGPCHTISLITRKNTWPPENSLLSFNQQQFAKYLLEVNEPVTQLHLMKMGKPFVWGMHIELKAASSYFQIPLYFCEKSPKAECYGWHCFSPICSAEKLNYPKTGLTLQSYLGTLNLHTMQRCITIALCQLTQTELPRFLLN